MKSIIKIHLCVLLLTIVWNGVGGIKIEGIFDVINGMANEDEEIVDIFKPSKDGLLALNRDSFSFKGLLLTKQLNVTMKFTIDRIYSDNEFKIYRHLHTIGGDTTFEVYGVPTIHYYGMLDECSMMAMTFFDPGYQQTFQKKKLTETDFLILFREIVSITRYIHANDVYHGHIHLRHIMFHQRDSFICDFSVAAILPGGKDTDGLCAAREDWKQLLRGMYLYLEKNLRWGWLGFGDNDSHRTESMPSFFNSLENDSKSKKRFTGLRRVIVEFAKNALSDDSKPINKSFYDEPLRVIREEIERCKRQQGKQVVPSWLPEGQDNVQPSLISSEESETRNRGRASSGSSRRRNE